MQYIDGNSNCNCNISTARHGESTWNNENKFTGWYDCPLSEKGNGEAIAAGKLLQAEGYSFDVAYTSKLKRAIRTLWHSLEQTDSMSIPTHCAWQLNERFVHIIALFLVISTL